MYYVSKQMEIAGSHRLELPYESKCRQLHGHNWIVTVHCKAKELNAEGPSIPRPKTSHAGYANKWNTVTAWTSKRAGTIMSRISKTRSDPHAHQ